MTRLITIITPEEAKLSSSLLVEKEKAHKHFFAAQQIYPVGPQVTPQIYLVNSWRKALGTISEGRSQALINNKVMQMAASVF